MSSDGPLLKSLDACKAMLRDCYWWRRLADPNNPWDEATAAAHIYYDGLPPPDQGADHSLEQLTALRPFALMWADQAGSLKLRSTTGGHGCPLPSGRIIIQLELPVPTSLAGNPHALATDLNRKIGRIMRTADADEPGLFELSGLAGYLPLTELELVGYVRTDAKSARDLGDTVVAELIVTWGLT